MQLGQFRLDQGIFGFELADENLIEGTVIAVLRVEIKAGSGIGLRVCVDDEDVLLKNGQGGSQVDGGGGFSHAAFLVGYGNNLSHICVTYIMQK